jgi:hypothetical protein
MRIEYLGLIHTKKIWATVTFVGAGIGPFPLNIKDIDVNSLEGEGYAQVSTD